LPAEQVKVPAVRIYDSFIPSTLTDETVPGLRRIVLCAGSIYNSSSGHDRSSILLRPNGTIAVFLGFSFEKEVCI
jgi:hypothetical protein